MIQETYDCLLTRAYFINNTEEEILESIDSKDTFISLIKRVADVMEQEDFFLTKQEYQEKLRSVLREYRFNYNDKSIFEDINYIVGRLNVYETMKEEKKNYLIDKFYKNEYAIRNLPIMYHVPSNIDKFMQYDFTTLVQLFPDTVNKESDGTLEIFSVAEFVSLMNILLNKHSEIFALDGFVDTTINNLNELLDSTKLPFYTLLYIKKTIKNVKKLEKGKYKVIAI